MKSRISRETYDKLGGANFSTIKELLRSPLHYLQALKHEREITEPLRMGLVGHILVFEPDRFQDAVAVWADENGRRAGKKWEAFCTEAGERIVIREKDLDRLKLCAAAVRASPLARQYLAIDGQAELSMAWEDPASGVKCKGRLDWRCAKAIVDLKLVEDASPDAFGRAAHTYHWPLQAAWYQRGDAATSGGVVLPFVFLAVEKTPPFVVQTYRVGDEVLEYGASEADELLAKLVELRKTWSERSRWAGYSASEMELELPRWAWPNEDVNLADAGLDLTGLEPEEGEESDG